MRTRTQVIACLLCGMIAETRPNDSTAEQFSLQDRAFDLLQQRQPGIFISGITEALRSANLAQLEALSTGSDAERWAVCSEFCLDDGHVLNYLGHIWTAITEAAK